MKPIVLMILDGYGIREEAYGNAIRMASTPNMDFLMNTYPHSLLEASGSAVGLPDGQMGNSNVGHTNIGAGRVVKQPLVDICDKITNDTFYKNEELLNVIKHVKENNSKLHILGLLSDGGIHSHISHTMAVLELARREKVEKVYFHVFLDGRDTAYNSAMQYLDILQKGIDKAGLGSIGTIIGRFYAMDRDRKWDRTKEAYDAMVYALGAKAGSYEEVIESNYKKDIYDEFIEPTVLDPESFIDDNDGIIFTNYRVDRATQILTAITNPEFEEFETQELNNVKLVTFLPCQKTVIHTCAFPPFRISNTLGEVISARGLKQLRIAETEKFAHVTYFFDGGEKKELDGSDYLLIHSPKVTTYDMQPEMSADEITERLLEIMADYDLVVLNYANPDMVGHTGNLEATIKAVETVDKNIGKVYDKVAELDGLLIITADHGNADFMLDEENNKITTHSNSSVPFIICDKKYEPQEGVLADIAPTILKLMKIEIPKEMTGKPLI